MPKPQIYARRAGLLAVIVFAGWVLWQYYQMSIVVNQQKKEIEAVLQEIEKVKAENSRLEKELQDMNSPGYLEKIARKDYGMIKDGEKIVVIKDDDGE